MQYVLGNMLNGGGINPDGLSLDLQFAADKTLTARRGPTPTFTRASTATFVGSDGLIQTAAIDIPRFDHDPVTLACKGLLIEEGRTNALQHSANFKNTTSSSYWENITGTTVTVDQTTSPDGGVNADLLSTSATAFDCFFRRANIWAASTQYTYSVFLKQGPSNHRYVGLYIGVGVSALKFPFFDFNNPTVVQIPSGTMVGTINSTRVDAYPNGWYRVIVTFTTAATPATTNCGAYISTSDGTLPASSAAGLDAYVWGIQSELGAFPTSYIPTTTAPLTRSADVCSITGANFTSFYNQSEGTFLSSTQLFSFGNDYSASYWNVFNPPNYMRVSLYSQTSTQELSYLQNNDGTLASTVASEPSRISRTAGAYQLNNARIVKNGTLGVLDTTFTPYSNFISLSITPQVSGTINSLRYYKKRLPDAKLQALTA
jgi:hypothetical protein